MGTSNRDWTRTVDAGEATTAPQTSPPIRRTPLGAEALLIAERYRLGQCLGFGGGGAVWSAEDTLAKRPVAVKLVSAKDDARLAVARREVTAMRQARLPGVVHLHDEGVHGDQWFIVMDLLDGAPFPGGSTPMTWADLREPVRTLLWALSGVHHAGLVHRDLKPGNVMVGPDGRSTVLDFGIARTQEGPAAEYIEGTPGYWAPEQRFGGGTDPRTDLYTVGVMIAQALTGALPRTVSSESVAARCANLPPNVAVTLERMLALRHEDRPASADVVLAAMGLRAPLAFIELLPDRPLTDVDLRALFHGPDLFLHLREDAARILGERSGGEPRAVRRIVHAWRRAGAVHVDDERLRITRGALDRLDAGWAPEAGPAPQPPLAEMLDQAEAAVEAGRFPQARALLDPLLARARLDGAADIEVAALRVETTLALAEESSQAIEHALYLLGRAAHRPQLVEHLDLLLRVARGNQRRTYLRSEALAAQLAALPEFPDDVLECWRRSVELGWARAGGVEAEAAMLAGLDAWAHTPRRRARLFGWRGNRAYRDGDYSRAAEHHLAARALTPSAITRIGCANDAAAALVELGALGIARDLAERSAHEAAALRHARYEGLTTWLARVAAYRCDEAEGARVDLVASAEFDPEVCGLLALNEAAVAWRSGDQPLARRLALRAEHQFRAVRHSGAACLARALAIAAGDATSAAVLERWARGPVPAEQAVQVVGLIRRRADTPELRALARELASRCERVEPEQRLDVLSIAESIA